MKKYEKEEKIKFKYPEGDSEAAVVKDLKKKTSLDDEGNGIANKINTALKDVNTINTLCSYGMFVYSTLHTMGKI